MNILIIGNGFDLAHKLKTGYGQFLDIVNEFANSKKMLIDEDEKHINHFYMLEEKLLDAVYHSDVYKYMLSKRDANKGWIDFENELREIVEGACNFTACLTEEYSLKRGESSLVIKKVLKPDWAQNAAPFMYYYIERHHIQPTQKIDIFSIDEKIAKEITEFVELFRRYLCWLDNYAVPAVDVQNLFYNLRIHYLLSFNYTSTGPCIYGEHWGLEYENICYVHGHVEKEPNNHIVMGIGSDFYDAYKYSEFLPFYKFYQCYKYKTATSYLKWIPDNVPQRFYTNPGYYVDHSDEETCNIYIYGHSLDPTDENILLPFLNYGPKNLTVKVIIYYLDEKSRLSIEQNLVKILGVEKFSKYLHAEDPRITFRKVPELSDDR